MFSSQATNGENVSRTFPIFILPTVRGFCPLSCFCLEPSEKPSLRGVEFPDPIRLSDFIGYEQQRLEVIENTEKFVRGLPANNVLLYGDRGQENLQL